MEQEPKKRSKIENLPKHLRRGNPNWVKGKSGNPKGHKLGQKNFKTLFREALIKLAKANDKDPNELELEILEMGIKKLVLETISFIRIC